MNSRGLALACLTMFLTCLSLLVPHVQAQTVTISNLQYPSQAMLQNGVAQVTVTFTVRYSGISRGGYIVFGVMNEGKWVTGSHAATPAPCAYVPNLADDAVCLLRVGSDSGEGDGSFGLTFNSAGNYALNVAAALSSGSGTPISGSVTTMSITIAVT